MGYKGKGPLSYMGIDKALPEIFTATTSPTAASSAPDLGDFWINTTLSKMYILLSKPAGVANWLEMDRQYDFQESVLAQAAIGAAVAAEGNRYLCNATGGGWTDTYIYEYHDAAWVPTVPTDGMVVFDEDTNGYLLYNAAAWGAFTTGITTIAAASDTNIVAPADAEILLWDGVNSWDNHLMSGDGSMTNAGVMSVSDLTIASEAQGDILRRNAASWGRLAAKTDKYILIGDGSDITSVAVSGDVAITNLGATTVTDFTLTSEAQGTIVQFDGTNWVILGVGVAGESLLSGGIGAANHWGTPTLSSATTIANNCVLNDAGGNDATLSFTTQTVGTAALTIPDVASVADTFAFTTLAQTLVNKTLTAPDINGGAADSLTGFSIRSSGAAFDLEQDTAEVLTGNKIISWNVVDTNRAITLGGDIALGGTITTLGSFTGIGAFTFGYTLSNNTAVTFPTTGTLATLAGTETFTNKIFSDSTCVFGDDAGLTKTFGVELSGATAATQTTFIFAQTVARSITFQDAAHTVIGRDTTDTLTEKSIDANGSGNAITNVNGAELEDAAATTALGMAIPFIIKKDISNNLTTSLYDANFPQKARLIKAWVEENAANTGTVTIDDGANVICAAVAYSGTDTDITDFPNIDDARSTLAANASLRCLNSVNTDDAMVYMMFIPIA